MVSYALQDTVGAGGSSIAPFAAIRRPDSAKRRTLRGVTRPEAELCGVKHDAGRGQVWSSEALSSFFC